MKLRAGIFAGWLIACAPLIAINFWEDKDFTAWSDKEVGKMLTNSPWSHKVVILTPDLTLAGRVGGLTGGVVGNGSRAGRTAGGGGVGGDGAGNLGGGSFLGSPQRTPLVVRWASARPVRQALARADPDKDAAATDLRRLEEPEAFYRVAVVGLLFGQAVGSASELQDATLLKRKGGAPIEPADVTFSYEGDLLTIEFSFPRTDAITLDDREVEFFTRLGTSELRTKFKLKDLVIGNQLLL